MATIIKAGNTSSGFSISGDNTSTLSLNTGTGAGTTALILDSAQNATFTNALSKIYSITASVAANALTVILNPCSLDFRSATLTSGTVNTRTVTTAVSMTVSSGSTLGTVSAQQSRIVVLAIDNAGTIELAVVNISGGVNLTETGVISTTAEGGAGAADSATVVYSTTARTSVPYRVVGYIESTQATAGTWATAPSTIQGVGGQALTAMSSLGYSQTWQNLTGSRVAATTYYNTTGRPIMVFVRCQTTGGAVLTVNGIVSAFAGPITGSTEDGFTTIVPPSGTYIFTGTLGASPNWAELR
jgi:hypothetical protein